MGETLNLLRWEDLLEVPEPAWLVDGYIPDGVVLVWGPPKVGKTFLVLDLALSYVCGLPWAGRFPLEREGRVLYVAGEGIKETAKRVRDWVEARGDGQLEGFVVQSGAVNVGDTRSVDALVRAVKDEGAGIVVIDTLNACFVGDENSSSDMGRFLDGVRKLRDETGAVVVVVHHGTKGDTTERGHGSLLGAVDASVHVTGGQKKRDVKVTSLRDGELPAVWSFDLAPTELGGCTVVAREAGHEPSTGDYVYRGRIEPALHQAAVEGRTPISLRALAEATGGTTHRVRAEVKRLGADDTSTVLVVAGDRYDQYACGCSEPHELPA